MCRGGVAPFHAPLLANTTAPSLNIAMKQTTIFVPGLLIGDRPYRWVKVDEIFCQHEVQNFRVHFRPKFLTHEHRAKHLANTLISLVDKGYRFHLIGHSAGGMDIELALYMEPLLQKHVISLTTLATPFAGTPIAGRRLQGLRDTELDELFFGTLETDAGVSFAEKIAYEMTAKYTSSMQKELAVKPELISRTYCLLFFIDKKWKAPLISWKSYDYLKSLGHVHNDSTVPTESMRHGHVLHYMPGDHKSQTLPFRYGLPFQTQYRDVWEKIICHQKSIASRLPLG